MMTGEEVIHHSFVFSVTKATFVDPHGSTFVRDIVRHPGPWPSWPSPTTTRWCWSASFAPHSTVGSSRCRPAPVTSRERRPSKPLTVSWPKRWLRARDLTLLTRCAITPGFCDERSSVYLATGLRSVPLDRQGVEEAFMEVVEVPLSGFDHLVDEGVIIDATTILGVGLARRRLAGR